MAFTTREKQLSIREMIIISGAYKSTAFAYFVAEVLCTVCRSVRIVRMETGIHDPRKRVVDPRNEYHYEYH